MAAAVLLLDGRATTALEAKAALLAARPVVSIRERDSIGMCESRSPIEVLEDIAQRAGPAGAWGLQAEDPPSPQAL